MGRAEEGLLDTDMTEYCKERLNLFRSLQNKDSSVLENGRLWTLEPAHLRFKYGESIAELKIPYHMGADDEACIEDAVASLIMLLIKRAEPSLEDAKTIQHRQLGAPVELKKKTFRTDIFVEGSLEKRFARDILSSVPNIDAAIVAAWVGSHGCGKKFIKWIENFFEKSLKEEARHGSAEETSYLALLAVMNTINKKKERIKNVRIKGITYEKLDLVVGLTLFIAVKESLKNLFENLRSSRAVCYGIKQEELLLSSVVPKSFLSIPSNLLSSSLNPYGLNRETFEVITRYAPFQAGRTADEVMDAVIRVLKKDEKDLETLKLQCAISRFRKEALVYLNEFDIQSFPQKDLYELYNDDRMIRNFMNDPKSMPGLSKSVEEIKKNFAKDVRRVEAISNFQRYLASFRKPVFAEIDGNEREDIFKTIEGFYACKLDDHVEKFTSLTRAALADKRVDINKTALMEDYSKGRLYRFSTDERTFLKILSVEEEGQLFIDMKDFTKKTLKIKEIAMVEFMKENFYRPVLEAAARYEASGLSSYEHGIILSNLLGDAAIFSGGIACLVSIAGEIRKRLRLYREQLLKKLPEETGTLVLDEVHKRFAARRELLRERRSELECRTGAREQETASMLAALDEEERRTENIYREELRTAILDEIEAGIFISHGAKAETMTIERKDDSTPIKVSIGEKINEAARGAVRNPLVRAKIEVLVENERRRRGIPLLKYPFDLYIERIYSIRMPPELDSAYEKLLARKSISGAKAMVHLLSNEYFNDLKRAISGEPFSSMSVITATTDIYNKGQALSETALKAYIGETKGKKWFFRKTVHVKDLDELIRNAFFFPQDMIELWIGHEVINGFEHIEIFRRAGDVVFRGFEANTPVAVYEMLNDDSLFFKSLASRHLRAWLEESKKD